MNQIGTRALQVVPAQSDDEIRSAAAVGTPLLQADVDRQLVAAQPVACTDLREGLPVFARQLREEHRSLEQLALDADGARPCAALVACLGDACVQMQEAAVAAE